MGLFDKKYCDVCGEKIGLLGNRKLEDGNLCKNCAAKLSPWFSGRRHSTLEDIKSQLADREANEARVSSFNAAKILGKGYQKLYIDEAARCFAVANESAFKKGNPDILPLSAVTGCETKEEEHRSESKYKNSEGKMVSYDPPRYEYSYDYECVITVEHPYIEEIRFRLNDFEVRNDSGAFKQERERREYAACCDEIERAVLQKEAPAPASAAAEESPLIQGEGAANLVLYHWKEADIDVPICFEAGVKLQYRVTDSNVFRLHFDGNGENLGDKFTLAARNTFKKLEEEQVPATELVRNPAMVQEAFKKELKQGGCEADYGIFIENALIHITLNDAGRETIQKAERLKLEQQMAAGLSGVMAAGIAAGAAPAPAAAAAWTCPNCGSVNEGKFCENCGTKRPGL